MYFRLENIQGLSGQEEVVGGSKFSNFCPRSSLKMSVWTKVVLKKGQNCVYVVIVCPYILRTTKSNEIQKNQTINKVHWLNWVLIMSKKIKQFANTQ